MKILSGLPARKLAINPTTGKSKSNKWPPDSRYFPAETGILFQRVADGIFGARIKDAEKFHMKPARSPNSAADVGHPKHSRKKQKIIVANPTNFTYQCGQVHWDGAGANRFCLKINARKQTQKNKPGGTKNEV